MMTKYQVATAAEAIAAGQFARVGCNVAVQYGANQPEYDLMISDVEQQRALAISVKGNQTGSWLLAARLHGKDYHRAIDEWLGKHRPMTVYCLVQFKDVALDQMPWIYLARPFEIADRLHAARNGLGHGALHVPLPDEWRLTLERLETVWSAVEPTPKASAV